MTSWPDIGATLTSSHSNSLTLPLSLPTSARSWTASWLADSYNCISRSHSSAKLQSSQWHSPSRASTTYLTTKHCLRWGQSLHQQLPHQWADSSTQPHRAPTIQLRSTGPNIFLTGPGLQQHLEPICQALPSLRSLNPVSTESEHSHPRPTSQSEATPTSSHLHGLPRITQHSSMDGTFYSRAGLAILPAMGPLPYASQTVTRAPNMMVDIATMAKVIPNVPLKLQQKIIQGEFIDLSELLQADFQFKYASIDSNDAFQLTHKYETVLM